MNILKKIFGNSNVSSIEKMKESVVEKIIKSTDDTNKIIIEIDNYICELCQWGEKMENLSNLQKCFYFNQNLEREINNGGFSQYFFNSSGDYALETIESLNLIGANKTAKILEKAIAQFPESKVPIDKVLREEILEQIEEKANIVWEQLDDEFVKYDDDLNSLNLEFVKKNLDSF